MKTFSPDFKQNFNLHSYKRSNRATFIPYLPGFVLIVIAMRFLYMVLNISKVKNKRSIESNTDDSSFSFQLNTYISKFQIIEYAKYFKNNLLIKFKEQL